MKVAVIGAGINGLFVTRELLSRGHDVTVYDTCLYGAQKRASSGSRAITVLYQKPGLNLDIMTDAFSRWDRIVSQGYIESPAYHGAEIFKKVDLVEVFAGSKHDAASKLFGDIIACQKVYANREARLCKTSELHLKESSLKLFSDGDSYSLFRPNAMILVDVSQYLQIEWQLIEKRISIRSNYANQITSHSIDGETFDHIFVCNGAWASKILNNWSKTESSKFVSSQLYLPFDYQSVCDDKKQHLTQAIRDYRVGSFFYYPGFNSLQPKAMKNNYGPIGEINVERQDGAEEAEVKKWLQESVLGFEVDFSKSQTCHYLVNPDGLPIVGLFEPIEGACFVLEAPGSGVRTAPTLAKLAVDGAIEGIEIDNSMSPNRFTN